jgi:carbon monoxide dehydrogenase subunit G
MPGAELTEDHGDGTYKGVVSVRLGPMTAGFEGQATVTVDAAAMSGHITGKGVDRRGGSRGQVKVDYSIAPEQGGARVVVDADITISGAAAQFGRTGLIRQISARLIQDFVSCLEAKLEAEDQAAAAEIEASEVKGLSLVVSTMVSGVKKLFKRG